ENRARFVMEVVDACTAAIGHHKVGIRLSPYGVFNDMPLYDEMEADYIYLAQELDTQDVVYIHLADHSSMGAPEVPASIKEIFRDEFCGTLILSGGYDAERAEKDMPGKTDLIAVGRPFLANPDLPARWQSNAEMNEPDPDTFYTPGEKGYIDYPTL
ncbi:MAG TPA: alkene reductase, partial [Candidatus Tenderia electrophaga]|nr:alkene reductase [Candidatus Tenderia electrophaga]